MGRERGFLQPAKGVIDEIKQRTGVLVELKRRPAVPAARQRRRTSTSCTVFMQAAVETGVGSSLNLNYHLSIRAAKRQTHEIMFQQKAELN
jgi:hypothetical protein